MCGWVIVGSVYVVCVVCVCAWFLSLCGLCVVCVCFRLGVCEVHGVCMSCVWLCVGCVWCV